MSQADHDKKPYKKQVDFLIVDDQETMLQAVRNMLKRGFSESEIVISQSGKEALDLFQDNTIKFLISDWNMPNLNGVELLKLLRNNPDNFNVPILLISDEVSRAKFLFAMEERVDGFQLKPFTEGKHSCRSSITYQLPCFP